MSRYWMGLSPRCLGVVVAMAVAIAGFGGATPALAEDCSNATDAVGAAICASMALQDLDERRAQAVAALQEIVAEPALREAIAADARVYGLERDRCLYADDTPGCVETVLRARADGLGMLRLLLAGPRLKEPPLLQCAGSSTVEVTACQRERAQALDRVLGVLSEAAMQTMRELDALTSANVGAEAAFRASENAFITYRDTACAAVGASFASGTGASHAELLCRSRETWNRARTISINHLNQPGHWSDQIAFLAPLISACLQDVEAARPRIIGHEEGDDGSQHLLIETDDTGVLRCETSPTGAGLEVTDGEAPEGEAVATFWPTRSWFDGDRLRAPRDLLCASYSWVSVPGSGPDAARLDGWLQRSVCL